MAGPEIRFSGVGLRLGGAEILRDIGFAVAPGSIHCIIGPNGGGKTTLIRCLLGQMPHAGSISIGWGERRSIGYVPQHLDFDKSLPITVSDFMTMICRPRRPAFFGIGRRGRATAEAALSRVGLEGKLGTRFGNLSGGERQRVLFAQALMPEPGLLVLDEPMTSMDEVGMRIFVDLVRSLAASGVTIVWIAHELSLVREVADRVTCIARTVLFSGAPRDVVGDSSAEELFGRAALSRQDAAGATA